MNNNKSNGSRKRSRGGASSSSSRGNSGNNGMKTSRPIISTTKKQKNHQSCRTVKPVTSFEKIKDAFRFYHKFGFVEPYNILFDAQFLIMATQNQVDLEEQLKRVLLRSEKFNLFCSNEVLHYLRSCPNDQHIKAVVMAKKFQRPLKKQYMTKEERRNKKKDLQQQQEQNLSNDLESLKKIANDTVMEALGEGNSRKFIVALGDNHLRTLVHKKYPTTPTLRVIRETIAIDAPSQTARGVAKQKEQKVVEKHSQLTPWEREQLLKLQKPTAASDDEDTDAAKLQKQQHVILTTDMDVADEGDEEHESTHKPELENEDQEEQEEEEGQEEQYESESSNGSEDEDEPQTKKSKKN